MPMMGGLDAICAIITKIDTHDLTFVISRDDVSIYFRFRP